MSKILIVQPHKMLGHAFAVALAPDHEIEICKSVPAPAAVDGADLAIVDAVSLRECDALTGGELEATQGWKVPIIWIDNQMEPEASLRAKAVLLKPPIDKETLKKTVAQSLGQAGPTPEKVKSESHAAAPAPDKTNPPETKSSQSAADGEKEFIELVDIVE